WPALPEAPSRLTTPQALYRGVWSHVQALQAGPGKVSWPGNRHGPAHVRLHPDPPAPSPALGHAHAGGRAVAGLSVDEHPARRTQARAAARMGRTERRPVARGHPALVGRRRTLAAPVLRAVPARRLGPPARQPGVPADLRPARGTGDGAVAFPAAVPA